MMDDPQNIWQSLPTQQFPMTAEQLRRRVHERREKTRSLAYVGMALALVLGLCFAVACYRAGQWAPKLGLGIIGVWCFYYVWHVYRWILPADLAGDAETAECLTFYRAELEKQRDYSLSLWRRSGLPFCFLGLALIVIPELMQARHSFPMLVNALPLLFLLAVWVIAFGYQRASGRRELTREIEELRAFERQK